MTLPGQYFDDLYAASADPWGFIDRWYEQRKRALTLAMLPSTRYRSGFEPGCSIGVLTRELADRCDALLAMDTSLAAVEAARHRCADLSHVEIRQARLPADWPSRHFDLIVLSEVGYYFAPGQWQLVADAAMRSAETVLAVHWRHPVADYPITGDAVHRTLAAAADRSRMRQSANYCDEDMRAEVWTRDPRSVGALGGLA